MPTEYSVSLYGLSLDVSVSHAYSEPSTEHANGYSELDWVFVSGTDEIGENISFRSLDFIAKEYQSEIERAIWRSLEG